MCQKYDNDPKFGEESKYSGGRKSTVEELVVSSTTGVGISPE